MVGLSVLLENKKCPQTVIDKIALRRSPPARTTTFLDVCLLCQKRLFPEDDIFMYKGDRAFCSVECRSRHIFMDEEERAADRENNCTLVAAYADIASSSSPARRGGETSTFDQYRSASPFFAY